MIDWSTVYLPSDDEAARWHAMYEELRQRVEQRFDCRIIPGEFVLRSGEISHFYIEVNDAQ